MWVRSETEWHKLGGRRSAGPQVKALGGPIWQPAAQEGRSRDPRLDLYIRMLLTAAHDSLQSAPIFSLSLFFFLTSNVSLTSLSSVTLNYLKQ